MKSLIPTTVNDEFNDKPDVFTRIKEVLHISIAKPYGKRLASLTEYFNRFTDKQIDEFVGKLAESKWVRNDQCTYDFIMRKDLVSEMLSDGDEVSEYYSVTILEV